MTALLKSIYQFDCFIREYRSILIFHYDQLCVKCIVMSEICVKFVCLTSDVRELRGLHRLASHILAARA